MQNKFLYAERRLSDFEDAMAAYGWVIYEDALDSGFVDRINVDLPSAYTRRREIQVKNGIGAHTRGALHHLVERENFSLPLLDKMLCHEEILHFLKGKYILNGFNATVNTQNTDSYLYHIHRDVRTYSRETPQMIQMIITLDDFTTENGATHFLSGSHLHAEKPVNEYFYDHADRALAPAGSVIVFDSNIWHAAGRNFTPAPRKALTLGYTRPFIKPQFDYTRSLGYQFVAGLNPWLRQVTGYNARVPETLEEYYQPEALRYYQADQG